MEQEYTKDYFWEVYKQLPEELKEALFSDKNNELIGQICAQAGLSEEQTSLVAKYTGRVIMGLLPLDELPITIELELNISQDLTSQINRQIYISIFKHLRVSLNKINNKNSEYSDVFTSSKDGVLEKEAPPKVSSPRPITSSPKPFSFGGQQNNIQKKQQEVFLKPTAEVFKPEPLKEQNIPENHEELRPPKIPTRDAFKSSLENINIDNINIPNNSKISDIPLIGEANQTDSSKEEESKENVDPYKEELQQ
jgi:hypothetical protein